MISNSSPLIFLSKINRLEILKSLFKTVTITPIIKNEVLKPENPEIEIIKKALEEKWIKLESPKNLLPLKIDRGEETAISLAKEKSEPLIIDDKKGTKIANYLGIKTLRTTTIILMALKNKIITEKETISLVNQLMKNGYYISPYHYSLLLNKLKG